MTNVRHNLLDVDYKDLIWRSMSLSSLLESPKLKLKYFVSDTYFSASEPIKTVGR